jgi:hypothetical protein
MVAGKRNVAVAAAAAGDGLQSSVVRSTCLPPNLRSLTPSPSLHPIVSPCRRRRGLPRALLANIRRLRRRLSRARIASQMVIGDRILIRHEEESNTTNSGLILQDGGANDDFVVGEVRVYLRRATEWWWVRGADTRFSSRCSTLTSCARHVLRAGGVGGRHN